MKKKMAFSFLILLLLFSLSFSQVTAESRTYYSGVISSSFTKVGADFWGSAGAAVAAPNIFAAPINNPANSFANTLSVCAEFGKWSASEWFSDFQLNGNYVFPTYFAISAPLKKIILSAGLANLYKSRLTNEMEIMTLEQPEGTGRYVKSQNDLDLTTFFISGKYSALPQINFGVTAGFNYLSHHDKLGNNEFKGHGYGFTTIIGLTITPFEKLNFAYTYTYVADIDYDGTFTRGTDIYIEPLPPGSNEPIFLPRTETFHYKAKFYQVFATGLAYKPSSFLALFGKVELKKWRYYKDDNDDVVNYHLGAELSPSKYYKLSLGYFTQYESDEYYFMDWPDQQLLTAGFQLNIFNSYTISASVIDSHLLKKNESDDKYMQTYFSTGLGVSF